MFSHVEKGSARGEGGKIQLVKKLLEGKKRGASVEGKGCLRGGSAWGTARRSGKKKGKNHIGEKKRKEESLRRPG